MFHSCTFIAPVFWMSLHTYVLVCSLKIMPRPCFTFALFHIWAFPHSQTVRKCIRCSFPPESLCDVRRSNSTWMQFRCAHLTEEEAFGHLQSKTESSMGEGGGWAWKHGSLWSLRCLKHFKIALPTSDGPCFHTSPLECSEPQMLQTDMLLIGLFHSQRRCSDEYVWFGGGKKKMHWSTSLQ